MTETRGPSAPQPNMRRCPHCRALNPGDADWCSQCLERFTAAAASPPPPPAQDPERKNTNLGKVLAGIAAAILILSGLAVAGFFLLLTLAMSMDTGGFGSNK